MPPKEPNPPFFLASVKIALGVATGFAIFIIATIALFTAGATAINESHERKTASENEARKLDALKAANEQESLDKAWRAWYQKPKECQSPQATWQQLTECANDKIRKKREFQTHIVRIPFNPRERR